MTSHMRLAAVLLPSAVFLVMLGPAVTARSAQGSEKSIFISVLDAAGNPVTDLKAEELALQEDTGVREVIRIKTATQPLAITVMGDTTKAAGNVGGMAGKSGELIRDIRNSLTDFSRAIAAASPESQISVMEFGQAAITITKFTNSLAEVEKGITKLFPKPDADSVLIEALIEANKLLVSRDTPRRAIIVVNIEPGVEQSRSEPQKVIDGFRTSRAALWAASFKLGQNTNATRDLMLNQLAQYTGGRREFIVGPSALETLLKSYAAALVAQYEVTYNRPATDKPAQSLRVGTTRTGVKLYASAFAPK